MSAITTFHSEVQTLYCNHHGWLQAWLRRRLGCSHSAEDLAQDTYTRILSGRQLADLREPKAYLATVAKGLLVNWYRRQSLERAYLDALVSMEESLAPSPEHQLMILQTLGEIDAMLDALPVRAKKAFLLSQLEGMKYEDIAQHLGVSLPSVKRYMQQAFRECLTLMP